MVSHAWPPSWRTISYWLLASVCSHDQAKLPGLDMYSGGTRLERQPVHPKSYLFRKFSQLPQKKCRRYLYKATSSFKIVSNSLVILPFHVIWSSYWQHHKIAPTPKKAHMHPPYCSPSPPSATRGRAMLWWQAFHLTRQLIQELSSGAKCPD
jgi:hypothetical protein